MYTPPLPPPMGEERDDGALRVKTRSCNLLLFIYLSFIYFFLDWRIPTVLLCYWILGRAKDFNLMEGVDFCCLKCRMKFNPIAALFMFGWLICVYVNSKESDFIFPWLVFWIKHGHIWTVGFYLTSDALGNDLWGVCCIPNYYRGVQVVASIELVYHPTVMWIFSQNISTLSLTSWKNSIGFTKS